MKTEQRTCYIADDGTPFTDQEQCARYENAVTIKQEIFAHLQIMVGTDKEECYILEKELFPSLISMLVTHYRNMGEMSKPSWEFNGETYTNYEHYRYALNAKEIETFLMNYNVHPNYTMPLSHSSVQVIAEELLETFITEPF